ncbi:MAG: hypothetical protein PVF43_05270 [Candidatus Eiseniibacteriota bacterium]
MPTAHEGAAEVPDPRLPDHRGHRGAPGIVEVSVVGLTFKTLDSVASPDEDGDGLIAVNDLQIWQQAFVTQAPLHQDDLDLDAVIAVSDRALWQVHCVAP